MSLLFIERHIHTHSNEQTNKQYAFKALKNEKLFQSALAHGKLNRLLGNGEYKWLSIAVVHALVRVACILNLYVLH